jgi:hypothetical protein
MSNPPIRLSVDQAQSPLPQALRNELYSALLSGTGITTIESTLTEELQRSGWLGTLKEYMTQLLRSGECTTVDELMVRVRDKIAKRAVNGTNGVNGVDGHEEVGEELDLAVPEEALRKGAKTVRSELDKVCEIGSET